MVYSIFRRTCLAEASNAFAFALLICSSSTSRRVLSIKVRVPRSSMLQARFSVSSW